jgi:hypothetical protein
MVKKQSFMALKQYVGKIARKVATMEASQGRCPLCNCPIITAGEGEWIYYLCAATQVGDCTYKEDLPWMSIEDYAERFMYKIKQQRKSKD